MSAVSAVTVNVTPVINLDSVEASIRDALADALEATARDLRAGGARAPERYVLARYGHANGDLGILDREEERFAAFGAESREYVEAHLGKTESLYWEPASNYKLEEITA